MPSLTRVMALELAPKSIRVNCYAPGNTDTPMVSKYYSTAPPGASEPKICSSSL